MPVYPSQYNFTQPVRYYKHNDPYYYEVDNLPIRQLEENVLWLKDQYSAFLGTGATGTQLGFLRAGDDIDLEWIKQFRPKWVDGRTIKVQSGRYIGRVNDARGKDDSNLADSYSATNTSNNVVLGLGSQRNQTLLSDIYSNFTTSLGAGDTGTLGVNNGLETMFTFYLQTLEGGGLGEAVDSATGLPMYAAQSTSTGILGSIAQTKSLPVLWHGSFPVYAGDDGVIDFSLDNFANLHRRHLELVRKWKGVYRTAVMDYIEETIEIPEFSQLDFTGDAATTATQRLDLLVVYGHPVDASSSDLLDGVSTSNQNPLTITNPKLGLIRGAGVGVKPIEGVNEGASVYVSSIVLDEGEPANKAKILANPNAERGDSNTGMTLADGTVINGSFPSPDDLGNIAASIAYDLQGDGWIQLVGQCVLPICYVIVEKGVDTLSQDRIIDIRPFLRSAEFTYNERAGVAAANPPLSMGNPAVGQAQLEHVFNKLNTQIATTTTVPVAELGPAPRMQLLDTRSGQRGSDTRVATAGYFWSLPGRGHPVGSGNRATDGCRMNSSFVLGNNSLMAYGIGQALQTVDGGADVDGFSPNSIENFAATDPGTATNPYYDSTRAIAANPAHGSGDTQWNLGVPIFNIDISNYTGASTVEEIEEAILDDYVVTCNVATSMINEDGGNRSALGAYLRGWNVVSRTINSIPRYFLTVRYDMLRDDINSPAVISATMALARKNFTF